MPSKTCRMQRLTYQICRTLATSWLFNLAAWSFLILHCVALVRVADNAAQSQWRNVSLGYFGFFLLAPWHGWNIYETGRSRQGGLFSSGTMSTPSNCNRSQRSELADFV